MVHGIRGSFYFDIPKNERDTAIGYLLNALIKGESNSEGNGKNFQISEDVNIYLAHLLYAAALPDYQKAVKRYVSNDVSRVAELVEETQDRVVQYFIYKVNADHILIHLGLFDDLGIVRGNRLAKSSHQFGEIAKVYYGQAAEFNRKIYRRRTAIGAVLDKLSQGFESYRTTLRLIRRDFFHFTNEFTDAAFSKFCADCETYEREAKAKELKDYFLDLYAEWLRSKDAGLVLRLREVGSEIRKFDPAFEYHEERG